MIRPGTTELPPEELETLRRAKRLEWITIAYLLSAIALLWLVLGQSQATKTAWFEDILSLIPPIAFLVAARYSARPASERFPYGLHRITSASHLVAAFALFAMGAYLLVDAIRELIVAEHPTIGTVDLFGQTTWLGWPMIAALAWSGIPAVFLGRAKLPLGERLHNKVLYADAKMNKADWMTAFGAIAGIIGIGFGLWWADGVAAALISLDILKDGFVNLRHATNDLIDQTPTTVRRDADDPLREEILETLRSLDWVRDARVRLREEGQVIFGEAFVVPRDETDLLAKAEDAAKKARDLDWRVRDLVVTPVRELPRFEGR